ncbi:MAG TPA: hypothetical protein VJB14_04020 [Planctomycetota bacterium]|nr:hypothetical protein [Planctomycetota bacterium]
MMNSLLELSVLLFCGSQEAPRAPWRTDVQAAREAAVQKGRPCVILLYVDSL